MSLENVYKYIRELKDEISKQKEEISKNSKEMLELREERNQHSSEILTLKEEMSQRKTENKQSASQILELERKTCKNNGDILHIKEDLNKKGENIISLQNQIDRVNQTVLFKHTQSVLPRSSSTCIEYNDVELDNGEYIIEAHCTYGNIGVMNDCGVILGLYEGDNLIATGSGAWYGHITGDSIHNSYQTIFAKGVLNVEYKKLFKFCLKPLGSKNTQCISYNSDYPSVLTIF